MSDVLIVLAVTALAYLFAGSRHLIPPARKGWLALLMVGFIAGTLLEWAARILDLWSYGPLMPTIDLFGNSTGVLPIIQITILPLASVYLARQGARRTPGTIGTAVRRERVVEAGWHDPKRKRLRPVLFDAGDCLFLILVSVAATAAMNSVHQLGWNLVFTLFSGMIVAMVVQVLLAMCVAPVLGSIESMVPSMVVAMVSPMAVCGLDLMGFHLDWRRAFTLGAAIGLVMFLFIGAYGYVCRRTLGRDCPGR